MCGSKCQIFYDHKMIISVVSLPSIGRIEAATHDNKSGDVNGQKCVSAASPRME